MKSYLWVVKSLNATWNEFFLASSARNLFFSILFICTCIYIWILCYDMHHITSFSFSLRPNDQRYFIKSTFFNVREQKRERERDGASSSGIKLEEKKVTVFHWLTMKLLIHFRFSFLRGLTFTARRISILVNCVRNMKKTRSCRSSRHLHHQHRHHHQCLMCIVVCLLCRVITFLIVY